MSKQYIITNYSSRGSTYTSRPLTIEEAVKYYGYTLEVGASYAHERGNKKINRNPTTIRSLITNLNNAACNSARNGCGDYYEAQPA